MTQDPITGAFIFQGSEEDTVTRYMWTCIAGMSLSHRIKFAMWIILLKIPKWVGYKPPEYYQGKSLEVLNKMAGK